MVELPLGEEDLSGEDGGSNWCLVVEHVYLGTEMIGCAAILGSKGRRNWLLSTLPHGSAAFYHVLQPIETSQYLQIPVK